MEHEVNDIHLRGRESPNQSLTRFIHQLNFIPGSAILPTNQRAADANFISQRLWEKTQDQPKVRRERGGEKSLAGRPTLLKGKYTTLAKKCLERRLEKKCGIL